MDDKIQNDIITMRKGDVAKVGLKHLAEFVFVAAGRRPLTMIEVGSYAGESMELFAGTGFIASMTCIDPWKTGYDPTDPTSFTDMEVVESSFDARMKGLTGQTKVSKFKGTLSEFVKSSDFQELGQVDFVYIDGDHRYEGCKPDIVLCRDIVKPRVAICGHDYYTDGHFPGVCKAVTECFGKPDKRFIDSSWCKLL